MGYKIAIPTYKRYDIFRKKTYKLLDKYGLLDKAILFIQNDEDAELYKEFGIKIVRGPSGYKNICNKITDYFPKGQHYVLMADDIGRVVKSVDSKKISVVGNLDKLFNLTFSTMVKEGASLGGYYPTPNPLWLSKAQPITTDLRFIYDPLCCIINNKIKVVLDGLNDFERTLEHYKKTGVIVRLNKYSFTSPYNPGGSGGCGDRDKKKLDMERDNFLNKYSKYISRVISHKGGSSSFVFKKKV